MKVLVACEFSGIVRDAFIERGHNAISCDLLPTERPGPHYQGDVRDILNDGWDLMIAHPPCTYLTNMSVRWLRMRYERWILMQAARDFFMMLLESNIEMVCIENPVPIKDAQLPDYHQIIEPHFHGHEMTKKTCLWLKELPPLMSSKTMFNIGERMILKSGKKIGSKWYYNVKGNKAKERSRFWPGIAAAMAAQWGKED